MISGVDDWTVRLCDRTKEFIHFLSFSFISNATACRSRKAGVVVGREEVITFFDPPTVHELKAELTV